MRAAVAFDHDPAIDDQVHPPDSRDRLLHLDGPAELPHQQARQCLRAGFRTPVHEASKTSEAARDACEDLVEVVLVDDPEVQGAVDGCDDVPRLLAAEGLHDRADGIDRVRVAAHVAPMNDSARTVAAQPLRT